MRAILGVFVLVWLACAGSASAHRLDEYLQATTIALSNTRIVVQLRLTPGVSVAPQVLAQIDADRDGRISVDEQARYVARIRSGLSVRIDGVETPLTLTSTAFATPQVLRTGMGDITLSFAAPTPRRSGAHSLLFTNRLDRPVAVYLVNTLVTGDARIRITDQARTIDQSSYRLSFVTDAAAGRPAVGSQSVAVLTAFFWHGVHHILTGYDHLLFVAALVLGAATLWDLVKVVTAFTIAHSLTLALATFNLVHLPSAIVEPVIAASIVFVAAQNLLWPSSARHGGRLAIAFVFGLFHGLGFAGGLLDVMHGMSRALVILALLGFSLGVEAGNQMVLLPLFFGLKAVGRTERRGWAPGRTRETVSKIGSAIICISGAFYLGVALTTGGS